MSCMSSPCPDPTPSPEVPRGPTPVLPGPLFRALRPKPTASAFAAPAAPVEGSVTCPFPLVITTQPASGRTGGTGTTLQLKGKGVFGPVLRFGFEVISGSEVKLVSKKLWFVRNAIIEIKSVGEPLPSS